MFQKKMFKETFWVFWIIRINNNPTKIKMTISFFFIWRPLVLEFKFLPDWHLLKDKLIIHLNWQPTKIQFRRGIIFNPKKELPRWSMRRLIEHVQKWWVIYLFYCLFQALPSFKHGNLLCPVPRRFSFYHWNAVLKLCGFCRPGYGLKKFG